MPRYKVLDWYVHQGHQYEFFKLNHDFYLVGANGLLPDWNSNHRPLGKNVKLITEQEAKNMNFDIVIVRTPIPSKRYREFILRGAAPIAVIQTTDPIWLAKEIKHIVWNSKEAMKSRVGFYKNRHQYHIIHGYDPNEFRPINIDKNERVLTVANHFKKRRNIMGYDNWEFIKNTYPQCDVIGSKNEDIKGSINHLNSIDELIKAYNSYSIYLNPTIQSAMPRSRAEAAMCGLPIVSTMYYDFKRYFKPGKDALMSNDKRVLSKYIGQLLESKDMREEYGGRARDVAVKHFHINKFHLHWQQIFDRAIKG